MENNIKYVSDITYLSELILDTYPNKLIKVSVKE